MGEDTDAYVPVVELSTLKDEGRTLVNKDGHAIALFYHEGDVRAVDNRCPHMGFPLTEGSVDDGILTCHWHHARFELSCGDTFDPWADDLPTYPVEVRDGDVYVRPRQRRDQPPADHWRDRLETGLAENLRLVLAKSAIGLADAGVPYDEAFTDGVLFGTRYRAEGWSSGLTIHTAVAKMAPYLDAADRKRALYVGLDRVAGDTANEPPKFDQPELRTDDVDADRLKSWFRETIDVRDADGAERCLRTAIDTLDQPAIAEILCTAATDHIYLNTGHTFDFINKTMEALDRTGWEHADDVLPSLVAGLAEATRGEEQSQWRQPIDLADLLFDTYEDLPDHVAAGDDQSWTEPPDFLDTLLSDDPHAIVDALVDAVRNGATTEDLAELVNYAAAIRIAQFGTANEFGDWDTVHHTYTYANAVHQATRRTDAWELYRGVFDAALNVYLDRFLNTPPARIPDGDPATDPDDAIDRLVETFDEEGTVDTAGQAVADYFAGGGDRDRLVATLGHALLREDAGFHTIQNVEVAVRQAELTDDPDRRTVFFIAAGRYLAAHTPTRREAEQTFTIAERLHRGEQIHEADDAEADAVAGDD